MSHRLRHATACGARAAALAVLALYLTAPLARAADGPGAPAFQSMIKAWSTGKLDDAIKAADSVMKTEPANVTYLNAIGGLYCEKAQKASVLTRLSWANKCHGTWERALTIDPKHAGVHANLIRYYLQAPGIAGGGLDKARTEATRMSALDPVAGEISWGHIARADKQLTEAERRYQKAAEIDTTGMRGSVELAAFYASQNRWTDAKSVFESRLTKDSGDTFAAYQLARLVQAQGADLSSALELFERYLSSPAPDGGPTHAEAWFRKGQVLDKLGRRADAIAALEQALKLNPGHLSASRELQKLKG